MNLLQGLEPFQQSRGAEFKVIHLVLSELQFWKLSESFLIMKMKMSS